MLTTFLFIIAFALPAHAGQPGYADNLPVSVFADTASTVEWESVEDRPYPFSGTMVAPVDGNNILSASVGNLWPADSFFDGWGESNFYSFTYLRYFYDYFAIDTSLHAYTNEEVTASRHNEIESGGVEFLLTVQSNEARVQPYIGAGVGSYLNRFRIEENGVEIADETDNTYGFVAKTGLRVQVFKGLFLGAHFKYFDNDQDFKILGERRSLNLGGSVLSIEIGIRF